MASYDASWFCVEPAVWYTSTYRSALQQLNAAQRTDDGSIARRRAQPRRSHAGTPPGLVVHAQLCSFSRYAKRKSPKRSAYVPRVSAVISMQIAINTEYPFARLHQVFDVTFMRAFFHFTNRKIRCWRRRIGHFSTRSGYNADASGEKWGKNSEASVDKNA